VTPGRQIPVGPRSGNHVTDDGVRVVMRADDKYRSAVNATMPVGFNGGALPDGDRVVGDGNSFNNWTVILHVQ